jgi:dTDP-4-amino-4,6-dideoxygalactose transaminase
VIYLPDSVINNFVSDSYYVLTSGILAEGPLRSEVEDLCNNLFAYNKVFTTLVNSNGSGLFTLLNYYKLQGYDKVLIQSNTMYGIYTLSNLSGMNPSVIESKNLVMDHDALLKWLENSDNKKYKPLVLYSHIGGSVGYNIDKILNICDKYNLPLIEDSAHTLGAQDRLYGDALVFSCYATKSVPSGEGGLVVTKNSDIDEFVRRFIIYDRIKMEYSIGLNLRVSEISALLTKCVLLSIYEIIDNRVSTLHKYYESCIENNITTYYDDIGTNLYNMIHNGYKFIITDNRVIDYFSNQNKVVTKGEYSGQDILTGTVFGYDLSTNPVTLTNNHICLNTNYLTDESTIEKTFEELRRSVL